MKIYTHKMADTIMDFATSKVGIVEKPKNSNRGEEIDRIQREFGYKGVQYCVLFVLFCYKYAFEKHGIKWIFPNTASSQTLYAWAKKQEAVFTNPDLIRKGDIIIWRKRKLWQGHAGLVRSAPQLTRDGLVMETIEGNTSSGDRGSQRDGGGIYVRRRNVNETDFDVDAFYYRGFIDLSIILRLALNEMKPNPHARPLMEVS